MVGISDDLKHDRASVHCFVELLLKHLHQMHPQVDELIIWSDNCSCQYKSRNPFFHISTNFGCDIKIFWNFYGSRHGKSSADGETGVLKSALGRMTHDTSTVIDSAHDVYTALHSSPLLIEDGMSRRHIYFVASSVIQHRRDAQRKVSVNCIPGTRQIHHITRYECIEDSVAYKILSCYCVTRPCTHKYQDWQFFTFKGWYNDLYF